MKPRHLAPALCAGLPFLAACNLNNDTGAPDPGMYWGWVCPDGGGTPVDASTSISYVASGSCGKGGRFALSVDGCVILGSWSALGLSNVQTVQYTSSPGLGGWSVSATGGDADGGAADGGTSWTCAATAASGGDLMITCSEPTSSTPLCQSTLTPVNDP